MIDFCDSGIDTIIFERMGRPQPERKVREPVSCYWYMVLKMVSLCATDIKSVTRRDLESQTFWLSSREAGTMLASPPLCILPIS